MRFQALWNEYQSFNLAKWWQSRVTVMFLSIEMFGILWGKNWELLTTPSFDLHDSIQGRLRKLEGHGYDTYKVLCSLLQLLSSIFLVNQSYTANLCYYTWLLWLFSYLESINFIILYDGNVAHAFDRVKMLNCNFFSSQKDRFLKFNLIGCLTGFFDILRMWEIKNIF